MFEHFFRYDEFALIFQASNDSCSGQKRVGLWKHYEIHLSLFVNGSFEIGCFSKELSFIMVLWRWFEFFLLKESDLLKTLCLGAHNEAAAILFQCSQL